MRRMDDTEASRGNARRCLAALVLLGIGIVSPTALLADVAGFSAGIGAWSQEPEGDLRSGFSTVDFEQDLGLDDDHNVVAHVAIEHPVPVLPNVRLQYARTDLDGANTLIRTIDVNGEIFQITEDVTSELELTTADLVLYYELVDTTFSLDVGLAARYVDGSVGVRSAITTSAADFKGGLPMLYAATRIDLPLTGLAVGARATGLAYDGHSLIDLQAHVAYAFEFGLGAELGWRSLRLELDELDDIDDSDIDVSGAYLMLTLQF